MRISNKKPPHYRLLVWKFGFNWDRQVAVWGDTLYTKTSKLPQHVLVHEEVHTVQQKHSFIFGFYWWVRYILSPSFRYRQELEAYGTQWLYIKKNIASSFQRDCLLYSISTTLSSPLYGSIVTPAQAKKAIETYEKEKTQ